jgi:hypothetical protein
MVVVIEIYNDPIVCSPKVVRPRGVREQHSEMPLISVCVQNGQPREPFRIESFRRYFWQLTRCGALAILAIDIEQYIYRRRRLACEWTCATVTEQRRETSLDRSGPTSTDTCNGGEPTVVCSNFEFLECIDMQRIMDGMRKLRSDSRHCLKKRLRCRPAAPAIQLHKLPCPGDFIDRCSQAPTNCGKFD